MAERFNEIKKELSRQLKIVSVSFTVLVHLLYIGYLRFALRKSIGNRYVNLVLVLMTAVFLVVYLIFSLVGKNKKNAKRTKKVYKRFKLLMKIFTVGTAVYTVFTALGSVSPLAILYSVANAIVLVLRLIFELIISLVGFGARKVKSKIGKKRIPDIPEVPTEQNSEKICETSAE